MNFTSPKLDPAEFGSLNVGALLMAFPISLTSNVVSHNGNLVKTIALQNGLTVLLGPNGSGKTHILRGLRDSFGGNVAGKKVRFLSAGRLGMVEQFRSDFDGQRGGSPRYDHATYGDKAASARRHLTETLTGDFQTLAERADILVKIQERLRKLFQRDILIDWDAGNLKVSFNRVDIESKPYSSGREASGLMHLVGILSALYDDEVGALLLDEPEVSLHPQLQAFLLKEILSVAGEPSSGNNKKLVVIATHSTEMIQIAKPTDLLSLVFCRTLEADLVQLAPDAGELKNKKIQALVSRLGQEHKLALFCQRPLLVEGPSDALVCSALAARTDSHLEAAGSQLLPVIGKGQMAVVARLMRLLGKKPVALTDADGLADGTDLVVAFVEGNAEANDTAESLGFVSATVMATSVLGDFYELVSKHWEQIAPIAMRHSYWKNKKQGDEQLSQRRAAFSILFDASEQEISTVDPDGKWKSIRQRLSALLDFLESVNLFVLRKGTVENYYQGADASSVGKPAAAADEAEHIHKLSIEQIETLYSDLVRCVRSASSSEMICEAQAIRDLLLAVVAPAHARWREKKEKVGDLNAFANMLLRERSNIFNLEIVQNLLVVSMKSKVLAVQGFPIKIGFDDEPSKAVISALAIGETA